VPAGESLLVLLGESTVVSWDLDLTQVRWNHEATPGRSTFEPLVFDGVVLAGTEEGENLIDRHEDGTQVTRFEIEGTPRSLAVSDSVLYIGTLQGQVYAIDRPRNAGPSPY
jgi:outer membrane protein assembly factor BamB